MGTGQSWLCICCRGKLYYLPMQHSSSSPRRRTAEMADPEHQEEEDQAGRGDA